MNYTDDTTPRPEPVPGGGPARTDSSEREASAGQTYGSGQTETHYYADRPGDGQGQYQQPGGAGDARYYQSSMQGGQYGSDRYGPTQQSGQYGDDRYGPASQTGPYRDGRYGPPPQGGSYGPNGQYYRGAYEAPVPPEVSRWNWGAFMFNWIWGCGNGAYLSLLSLIPLFNIVWVFVCGARGNVWAWKSGKFKDLDTFLTTQRTWNTAGLIMFLITLAVIVLEIVAIGFGLWSLSSLSMLDQGGYTDFGDYTWS